MDPPGGLGPWRSHRGCAGCLDGLRTRSAHRLGGGRFGFQAKLRGAAARQAWTMGDTMGEHHVGTFWFMFFRIFCLKSERQGSDINGTNKRKTWIKQLYRSKTHYWVDKIYCMFKFTMNLKALKTSIKNLATSRVVGFHVPTWSRCQKLRRPGLTSTSLMHVLVATKYTPTIPNLYTYRWDGWMYIYIYTRIYILHAYS